ncbi:hypothetical protein KCP75_01815 [Salmonella enterica subsp. enterica]|nr:hypothetical protein KCP75_01815 [Salmonella enterica subsp. enterica]
MTATHQHFRGAIADAAAEQIGKNTTTSLRRCLRDQIFEGLFAPFVVTIVAIVGAKPVSRRVRRQSAAIDC